MTTPTPSDRPTAQPAFRTAPAPAKGSRLKFVGGGSRRGLTKAEMEKAIEDAKNGVAGAPTTLGTGGIWGSGTAAVTGYGTIQSARRKRTADKEVYQNNDGEVTARVYFNFRTEGSAELLVPDSYTPLEPGDQLSAFGETLVIDDAEEQYRYRGWVVYSVNFSKEDTLSLA